MTNAETIIKDNIWANHYRKVMIHTSHGVYIIVNNNVSQNTHNNVFDNVFDNVLTPTLLNVEKSKPSSSQLHKAFNLI